MNKLGVLLLGEGLVFHGVGERLTALGHDIVAKLSTSDLATSTSNRKHHQDQIDAFVAANPCHVLLSVSNPFIIRPLTIARPAIAAVNYHNSPLPAYAGLRATSWAIANQEPEHGICWHLIDPEIDAGSVLVQRKFALASDETTSSLNMRCTAAALETVDELFALLAVGQVAGLPQSSARRSYYGRRDIAPQAGILDFSRSMQEIVHLVRACDWGAAVNDFGSAKLFQDQAPPAIVLRAEAVALNGAVGTILEVDDSTLTVGCSDGAVRLSLDRAIRVDPGATLPAFTHDQHVEAIAGYKLALLQERTNHALYQAAASAIPELSHEGESGSIATPGGVDRFLKAVSRVLGRATICAIESNAGSACLQHEWSPLRAGDGIAESFEAPCRDIHRRWPGLRSLERWPHSATIRIRQGDRAVDHPPGTITFDKDGVIHFNGLAATAKALAEAMILTDPQPRETDDQGLVPLRILAVAKEHPHATAIDEPGLTTTYAALTQQARAVASALMTCGTQPEDGIGVLLPASGAFVTAALGAMLSGAAYVPLDPASPVQRLLLEIEGAGISQVISSRELGARLSAAQVPVLFIEDLVAERLPQPAHSVAPHSCAYRIFTSGSTGRPKAVEVTHAALANLVGHCCSALPLGANDRMTMLARPTFDASVADIWPILTVAGTLVVPPPRILLDQARLLAWLTSTRATCAFVPTAIAEHLLHVPWPTGTSLHTLLTGGDALHRRPPPGLPCRLVNSYGPTENTVASLWSVVTPGAGQPAIGRPITGVYAQVLDSAGDPVPLGQIGELMLGGAQLARGYFGMPELTAERFLTDESGERYYRTGDRVCLKPDGEYEFHGRIDDQVQVLGIRVEPGEIEALLVSDLRVAEAACVPWRSGGQIGGLIAFVVPEDWSIDHAALAVNLRRLLRERLPSAIVPRDIRIVADLPYRTSGKIDRKALAVMAANDDADPGDLVEQAWRRALPHVPIGEPGNFWDLGGDSLAAITLLTDLEALVGLRISTGKFLVDPTLAGLRRLVDEAPNSSAVQLRAGRSPVLVCWYGITGDLEMYQHMLAHLPNRRIIGIVSPGLEDIGKLPDSVELAAATGLRDLAQIVDDEPLIMLGFSFGGLLAFEAGRQLAQAGRPPLFVGLLGARPPLGSMHRRARMTYLIRRLPRFLWQIIRGEHDMQLPWRTIPRELLRVLGFKRSLSELPRWVQSTIQQRHFRLSEQYQPPLAQLPIHLFRELGNRDSISLRHYLRYDLEDLGWGEWNDPPPDVHWIDAHHGNMMKHGISDVADVLEHQISRLSHG